MGTLFGPITISVLGNLTTDLVRCVAKKPCAPYCSLNCVHQASMLDEWRIPQRDGGAIPLKLVPSSGSARVASPEA